MTLASVEVEISWDHQNYFKVFSLQYLYKNNVLQHLVDAFHAEQIVFMIFTQLHVISAAWRIERDATERDTAWRAHSDTTLIFAPIEFIKSFCRCCCCCFNYCKDIQFIVAFRSPPRVQWNMAESKVTSAPCKKCRMFYGIGVSLGIGS